MADKYLATVTLETRLIRIYDLQTLSAASRKWFSKTEALKKCGVELLWATSE